MPSRNSRKTFCPQTFYHIYNRGVEKRDIFIEDSDFSYFLYILKRHLSKEQITDNSGRPYNKYSDDVSLVAFCLMKNHFHLLLYLKDDSSAITKLMTSVGTAYTMYFNKKYGRVGHLFQERFKASPISNDSYIQHVSRYIHLNPANYQAYRWSSYTYYLGKRSADWVKPDQILEMFEGIDDYKRFTADYEAQKKILDELKYELAYL